jgi:hypothetical protein
VNAGTSEKPLTVEELHARFAELTRLLYDTSVPLGVLEREVMPHLAPNIEFVDPLMHSYGFPIFRIGVRGFHCTFPFDFDIAQIGVQLDERGDRGRAIVDGIMNLRSLRVYTYPLRTILVYDFVMTDGGRSFLVTRLDEMWSFGDLFSNLPVVRRVHDVGRRGFGYFMAGLFWTSCAIRTRLNSALLK